MLNILWNPLGYTTADPNNPGQYLGSSGHMIIVSGIRGDGTAEGSTLRVSMIPGRPTAVKLLLSDTSSGCKIILPARTRFCTANKDYSDFFVRRISNPSLQS